MPQEAINMPSTKKKTGIHPFTVKYVINDLLTITEVQQRSRVIRQILITAQRFLASGNQIQLIILELNDLGHRIGSFSTTQNMQK